MELRASFFFRTMSFTGRELLYCDPPYLLHTRTSKRRYRYEYTEADHVRLLELLKTLALCGDRFGVSVSLVRGGKLKRWNSVVLTGP